MLEACGPGEIAGDPRAIRAIADALEQGSRDAEEIADLIRLAGSTALAGWDAPSAQGYEAFCAEALTCAHGLIDVGPAAAGPLRVYADELEAAQKAFAAATADAAAAERDLDSAERGSPAEEKADEALGDARGAMGNAGQAALAANERAARAIEAIADSVPAAPAAPVAPTPPEVDKPWYEDVGDVLGGGAEMAWDNAIGNFGIGTPLNPLLTIGEAFDPSFREDFFWGSVVDPLVGLASLGVTAVKLDPRYRLIDPQGQDEELAKLRAAAEHIRDDPFDAAKRLIGWDHVERGQSGRMFGGLFTDAALALAGGAGVGTRLARTGDRVVDLGERAREAEHLEDAARAAHIPAPPPGRWVREPGSRGYSDSARRYQEFNGGRPDEAFRVERGGKAANFDSYDGDTLIDSKDRYDQFFDKHGEPKGWWSGRASMLETAKRQVEVAGEHPVEWRFNHRGPAMEHFREQFARRGIPITVRHVPMNPGG